MKKALLIGIDYVSTPSITLNGCIYDVTNMRDMLMDAYDYDISDITILRDDFATTNTMPTRANIMNGLQSLVKQSANLEEVWIHYSGHGSRIPGTTEMSGYDQLIVPSDYKTSGFIIDNDLIAIISQIKCRTVLLFDSCYSGTVCDLPWSFTYVSPNNFSKVKNNNMIISNPNIFMFSGCKDNQTSADTYSADDSIPEGAFTLAFITCLRNAHHNIGYQQLYQNICIYLKNGGYPQIPVFSSSSATPTCNFTRALTLYSAPKVSNLSKTSTVVKKNMRSVIYF